MDKVIWMYWHQGWDLAPEICARCKSSWIEKNEDWEIRALCAESLSDYLDLASEIPDIDSKKMGLASRSDLLRISLLNKYGGIWADSTVLCNQPLHEWFGIYDEHDFFAFDKPGKDRMVSSWFLKAEKGAYIVEKWFEESRKYWQHRDFTDEYFWFHFLFNHLYSSDSLIRKAWDRTPKLSAQGPHFFAPYATKLFQSCSPTIVEAIDKNQAPMFKLTYRYDHNRDSKNTVLEHLLNSY